MLKKVICIIFIITALITCLSNNAYATTLDGILTNAEGFLEEGTRDSPIDEKALSDTSGPLYNTLVTIAIVIAFVIGIIIGIQFLMGSAEDQAKVKETLVPYVIGVFIVFSSFTIWKIAVNIGNEATNEKEINTEIQKKRQEDDELSKGLFITKKEFDNMNDFYRAEYKSNLSYAIRKVNDGSLRRKLQEQYEQCFGEKYEMPK